MNVGIPKVSFSLHMNEAKCRKILGRIIFGGELYACVPTNSTPKLHIKYKEGNKVFLDGMFKSEELLAIAWWMDNKNSK